MLVTCNASLPELYTYKVHKYAFRLNCWEQNIIAVALRLLLGTEAPIMTPNGVDVSFHFFLAVAVQAWLMLA